MALLCVAGVIIIFQTYAITEDAEKALNGIDWFLAYALAVRLIIIATQGKRFEPITTNPFQSKAKLSNRKEAHAQLHEENMRILLKGIENTINMLVQYMETNNITGGEKWGSSRHIAAILMTYVSMGSYWNMMAIAKTSRGILLWSHVMPSIKNLLQQEQAYVDKVYARQQKSFEELDKRQKEIVQTKIDTDAFLAEKLAREMKGGKDAKVQAITKLFEIIEPHINKGLTREDMLDHFNHLLTISGGPICDMLNKIK